MHLIIFKRCFFECLMFNLKNIYPDEMRIVKFKIPLKKGSIIQI